MDIKLIGTRIKELRQERGITQGELAKALMISYQAVSNWERGVAPPDLENLIRIASYFGVLTDDLLHTESGSICLGIDGGGTKTEFVLVSSNGSVLKRIIKGGCNPNDIGFTNTEELIFEGIREIYIEYPSIKSVFCGVAGIYTGNYINRLRGDFQKNFPKMKVEITVDAFNLFAMDDDAEIALISDIGSVVYVRKGDTYKSLGGWGYLLDRAGSAYDIGRDAICHALHEEDRMLPPSKLSKLLKESLKIENVWEHLNVIYNEGNSYIASLAPVVFDAYAAGDEAAIRIIDDNARVLAMLLNDGVSLYSAKPLAIASGGLFEYGDIMLSHIAKYTDVKLKTIELPPIYGACKRACAMSEGAVPEDFFDNFKRSYGGRK